MFHPPRYVFEGTVPYSEIEVVLDWLETNLVSKRAGIERRYYTVAFSSLAGLEHYRESIPLQVTIYEQSYAAMFRLRWVEEQNS